MDIKPSIQVRQFFLKKMLFVMNPYSGTRRANKYLVEILEQFNRFFSGEKDLPGLVTAERTLTMTIETPNLKKG